MQRMTQFQYIVIQTSVMVVYSNY